VQSRSLHSQSCSPERGSQNVFSPNLSLSLSLSLTRLCLVTTTILTIISGHCPSPFPLSVIAMLCNGCIPSPFSRWVSSSSSSSSRSRFSRSLGIARCCCTITAVVNEGERERVCTFYFDRRRGNRFPLLREDFYRGILSLSL